MNFKDFKLQRPGVVFEGRFSEGSSHHLKRSLFEKMKGDLFAKNPTLFTRISGKKSQRNRLLFGGNFFWLGMARGMGEVSITLQVPSISRSNCWGSAFGNPEKGLAFERLQRFSGRCSRS